MDGWFDSGSTHFAAMERRSGLLARRHVHRGRRPVPRLVPVLPADQRAARAAPYKSVLCHGWTVDGRARPCTRASATASSPARSSRTTARISSVCGPPPPTTPWMCAAGKNIFKQLSQNYLKIRNTARFILGNLDGFDPNTDCVADDQLQEIDRWALAALDDLIVNTSAGYAVYDFNKVYHAVYNFCVVAMSNFYLSTSPRIVCTAPTVQPARPPRPPCTKSWSLWDKILPPSWCFTSQEIGDFSCLRPRA